MSNFGRMYTLNNNSKKCIMPIQSGQSFDKTALEL